MENAIGTRAANEAGGGDPPGRRALLVPGMYRSGTSAVARCLSLLGAALPRTPRPPEDDGAHWGESDPIVAAHDELLASAGSSWDDVLPFPPSWHRSPAATDHREKMAAIAEGEYSDAGLFVVGDPRTCRLVPFWIAVLDELEARPGFVLPLRDPNEVAASLADRNGFPPSKGLLLWLRHVLDAERDTRGHPRALVAYDDLLRDPGSSTRAIFERIGLDWPRPGDQAEIELEGLRFTDEPRHGFPAGEPGPRRDVVGWVEEAYVSLLDACRSGDAPDSDVLDRVSAALANADLTYGAVLAEARLRAGELRDQLAARDRRLDTLEKLRAHAAGRLRRSDAKLRESERKLRKSERKVRESERKRRATEKHLRAAEQALTSVESSLSWRLTKPLRAAKALINRPRRRGKRP